MNKKQINLQEVRRLKQIYAATEMLMEENFLNDKNWTHLYCLPELLELESKCNKIAFIAKQTREIIKNEECENNEI